MHSHLNRTKIIHNCFVLQFEEALHQMDPLEGLRKLVDPRLKENYPIDSVLKVGSIFSLQKIECYFFFFSICIIYQQKKKAYLCGIAFQINVVHKQSYVIEI